MPWLTRSLSLLAVLVAAPLWAQEIVVVPTRDSGVFDQCETVTWQISYTGESSPTDVSYVVKKHGQEKIAEGKLDLSKGPVTVDSTLDEPGALLLVVQGKAGDKSLRAMGGAVFDPTAVTVSSPAPDDFDAFWADKIKELQAVPMNATLEPGEAGKEGVDYFKVQMDNIRGSRLYAQLAKPKKEGKFPALLIVQYAGVYGLQKQWVTDRAAQGWLTLNVMAHDLPIDQPAEFYNELKNGKLKNYIGMGNESRDTSYFLRMYLSCYRAADYLAGRDDWDGRTLVVMGTSQGGQQAFVTAGLHPKITAMIANVPAGCDVTAPLHGRAAGFPNWDRQAASAKNPALLETGRYYDAAHFAARVKVPALVAFGNIDETCPPTAVLSAINALKGPKQMIVMPLSSHQDRKGSQKPYQSASWRWLQKLVKGETEFPKVD